ncbi:MAG: SDR family NAD(P)-dependent oxidoreductase, partial [Elusimicrobia bacterium]|nr:SDR family NAD(P)-dependent oxidoreductase [Elusimicrobiota bacterium]
MAKTVTVTGATGHIGKKISELLLAQGIKVRAVARHAERLQDLVGKGAEAFAADMNDPVALQNSFSHADAVFAMIPPNIASEDVRGFMNKIADNIVTAAYRAQVTHLVALSSVGANRTERVGPVLGLHDYERKLSDLTKT